MDYVLQYTLYQYKSPIYIISYIILYLLPEPLTAGYTCHCFRCPTYIKPAFIMIRQVLFLERDGHLEKPYISHLPIYSLSFTIHLSYGRLFFWRHSFSLTIILFSFPQLLPHLAIFYRTPLAGRRIAL